jgi:hypothetical protein
MCKPRKPGPLNGVTKRLFHEAAVADVSLLPEYQAFMTLRGAYPTGVSNFRSPIQPAMLSIIS